MLATIVQECRFSSGKNDHVADLKWNRCDLPHESTSLNKKRGPVVTVPQAPLRLTTRQKRFTLDGAEGVINGLGCTVAIVGQLLLEFRDRGFVGIVVRHEVLHQGVGLA